MTIPKLPNTTLCAIVRDEVINPAGGIANFIKETVPYVERAVIVDTGSVDGTWQVLQEATKQYSNLTIDQIPWNGYAESRNHSLKLANTDHILVLDADERITPENFKKLKKDFKKILETQLYDILMLKINTIFPDRQSLKIPDHGDWTKRFFKKNHEGSQRGYYNYVWELISLSEDYLDSEAEITHYSLSSRSQELKIKEWYNQIIREKFSTPPSKLPNFKEWKKPHPNREKLVGVLV